MELCFWPPKSIYTLRYNIIELLLLWLRWMGFLFLSENYAVLMGGADFDMRDVRCELT
jgi:hypothetical protein